MRKIRVAIVEDDQDIREFLQMSLAEEEDFICMHTFERAEDYLKKVNELLVDVVLMDITLPGMTGIQCVRQAKPMKPEIQYLMCTSHNDVERTFDSLCAGATGYIVKGVNSKFLFKSIKEIFNGGSPMSAEIARMVVDSFSNKPKNPDIISQFTTREQEVLYALAKGYSYKEIADNLFISIETVRTYLRKIYQTLQVHSKIEALNKVFPK